MQKRISILIVPEDGNIRKFIFSTRKIKIITCILIVILAGIVWVAYEYGNMVYKDIKIRTLEAKNKELMEKHAKFSTFEKEFNDLKKRTSKIVTMLGIEHAERLYSTKTQTIPLPTESRKIGTKKTTAPSIPPTNGWITKRFSANHKGLDFAAKLGTEVVSTIDGIVEHTGWNDTLGYVLKITNEDGWATIYGHLEKFKVETGDSVKTGDLIGFVGSTGKSSAPHLHYEVLLNGVPQNPETYLK